MSSLSSLMSSSIWKKHCLELPTSKRELNSIIAKIEADPDMKFPGFSGDSLDTLELRVQYWTKVIENPSLLGMPLKEVVSSTIADGET